jgi:hypothetical protein
MGPALLNQTGHDQVLEPEWSGSSEPDRPWSGSSEPDRRRLIPLILANNPDTHLADHRRICRLSAASAICCIPAVLCDACYVISAILLGQMAHCWWNGWWHDALTLRCDASRHAMQFPQSSRPGTKLAHASQMHWACKSSLARDQICACKFRVPCGSNASPTFTRVQFPQSSLARPAADVMAPYI